MRINKRIGISLVVLVVTIVVVIILASSLILSITNNNPISKASKAVYLSDLKNFQTELSLYQTKQFSDKLGEYDPRSLQADDASVTYNGILDTSKTMKDLIPSLSGKAKYAGQFQIIDGQLVYGGLDTFMQEWSTEIGVEVVIIGEPKITIVPPIQTLVERGVDIVYTIKFSSNLPLTVIDLTDNIEISNNLGEALPVQPAVIIGTVSGTEVDSIRQVDVIVKTDNLSNGSYKLKVKSGSVTNANNISNTIDIISLIGFDVSDIIPPINPIMSASVTDWTNGDVSVTINYSEDSKIKEYSIDSINWNDYTGEVVVTENNTTVYARGEDLAGNESGVATLTVSNIDKVVPTIAASSGSVTTSSITVIAAANDEGGSSLNLASYEYSKDNGLTWVAGLESYTFNALLSGTYECRAKVTDNAGNIAISDVVSITTTGLGTIAMSTNITEWTNQDVTVTIDYPDEVVTKQYSTDSITWNTYISPVVVNANNTTVYSKGLDIAGNQTMQSTLTVSNIDKVVPTITASSGSVTTSSITVIATANDEGGSSLNVSSYEYSKDNGVTWVAGLESYTFNTLLSGTYDCKVKVTDNAGNIAISDVVSITTTGLGTIAMSTNITEWTNQDVTVTIDYPDEVVTRQYSANGTTWNTYTAPIVITTNNTTVYAKGLDAAGNQTVQSTLTIANIDKVVPTVAASSGSVTTSSITVIATANDTGGSSLNVSSYQYSKDNGVTWVSGLASHTFSGLLTGTYECKVKVADNAGNITISSAVAINTTGLGTTTIVANVSTWTNGNVTVTINYPTEVVTKQYSTNGTTWNTYTAPIVVSTNNTTVYAKGLDAAGNQTVQASLTVSNIDKTLPTVPTSMGMTYSDGITNYINNTWTSLNVYIYGGISGSTDTVSGVNKYQISTDNVNWVDYAYNSGVPLYGLSSSGTHYRYARAVDRAGNVSSSYSRTIKIDKTAPTAPTFMGMTYSDGTTNYINDTWATSSVYIYGGISGSTDTTSGVNKYQISADNVNWVDYAYNSGIPLYGLTSNGIYYRYARAVDLAGNVSSSYSRTIKIDSTAPNAYNMTITKTQNSITVSGSTIDSDSGINRYHYYINGSWTAGTTATSHTFTGLSPGTTYSIYMTAYNNSGLQALPNGGIVNVTTESSVSLFGNPGTSGYGIIRTPASISNATELCVNGIGQSLTSGVRISGLNIIAGDAISVTYATNRSYNSFYLDLYDNLQPSGSYFALNIQYSQNMVTTTKNFTAARNATYYDLSIYKSDYTGSDIYGTLYIYNISVNGVKIF